MLGLLKQLADSGEVNQVRGAACCLLPPACCQPAVRCLWVVNRQMDGRVEPHPWSC